MRHVLARVNLRGFVSFVVRFFGYGWAIPCKSVESVRIRVPSLWILSSWRGARCGWQLAETLPEQYVERFGRLL